MARHWRTWLASGVLTVLLCGLLIMAADPLLLTTSKRVQAQGPVTLSGAVGSTISYQGYLQESGSAVTGTRDMVFRFYSDAGCTSQVGAAVTRNDVQVTDGLFSVTLDVDAADFDGQALWLGVDVEGVRVVCQEILPAPYALSLRPNAIVAGDTSGSAFGDAVVNVDNTSPTRIGGSCIYARSASHAAIYAEGGGGAVYAHSTWDYAIKGEVIAGTAGYFDSGSGIGVVGNTDSAEHYHYGGQFSANAGYGVLAESETNNAVRAEAGDVSGLSSGSGAVGVVARGYTGGVFCAGNSYGLYGLTATNTAVLASSDSGVGLKAISYDNYAVAGYDMGSEPGHGYGGYFQSSTGIGVYGESSAQPVTMNRYVPGVMGRSENGAGVYGIAEGTRYAGVYGRSDSGAAGVYGYSSTGAGVRGYSSSSYGGYFTSSSAAPIYG